MYIVITSHSKSPELVEPHFKEHCEWLKQYNHEGIFLASGPKKSGRGGAILVRSMDKKDLEKIIAKDSYHKANVADYLIVDIDFKLAVDGFEKLIEA